jgi:hypothetical protein
MYLLPWPPLHRYTVASLHAGFIYFFDRAFFSGAHERPPLRQWGVDTCGAFRPLWHAAFVLRDTLGCVGGSRTAVLPSAAKASRVLGVSSPLLPSISLSRDRGE